MDLPITAVDMALGNIELRKVVIHRRADVVLAFFHHIKYPKKNAFTASVKFYMKDGEKWVTHLKVYEAAGIVVAYDVKKRLEDQLTLIFAPYFDNILEGNEPW